MDATLDEKLEPITKRFETVEKNMATKDDLKHMATKTDIHDIAEEMPRFFHKTWEKLVETNERVTIIEDQLDMPHPKENKTHFQKEQVRFLPSYGVHFLFYDQELQANDIIFLSSSIAIVSHIDMKLLILCGSRMYTKSGSYR